MSWPASSMPLSSRVVLCSPSQPTTHSAETSSVDAVAFDRRDEAALVRLQLDETGRADDLAALPVEVVGQDRLGHLLRDADVEAVAAAADREVDLAEHAARGVEPREPLLDARGEERLEEAERLEDLEGARMHDRRPVPVQRRGMCVDEAARDAAAVELRRQEQPGRACADHENGHLRSHMDSRREPVRSGNASSALSDVVAAQRRRASRRAEADGSRRAPTLRFIESTTQERDDGNTFFGTSRNGRLTSSAGSRGRPSTRSPMMLR